MEEEVTYSVTELGNAIQGALLNEFPRAFWVRGEVSQFRVPGGRHAYFDLVEKTEAGRQPEAKLGVALWQAKRLAVEKLLAESDLELRDGAEVRIRVRLDFYAPHGKLQLQMDGIDPIFSVGKLAAERARVLGALQSEGLLDRQSKLLVPLVPLRIGLVTSNDSAAYHDFVEGIKTSGYAFSIILSSSTVQGADAPESISVALKAVAKAKPDVIALVRGGGAKTDLAAFDAEVVARTIASLKIPVFTGVGHEIDRSIADEVAKSAFKTPTAVASHLVELVGEYASGISRIGERVLALAETVCVDARSDLADVVQRISRGVPQALMRESRSLDASQHRLIEGARRKSRDAGVRIGGISDRLRALDPKRVLARGYSITRTEDGRVLRAAATATVGKRLLTETAAGIVASRVEPTE